MHAVPSWVLLLVAGLWTVPTTGLLVRSLRPWGEQQVEGWWMAFTDPFEGWTLDGYRALFSSAVNNSFADGLLNSLAIAVPGTVLPLLFSFTAAYALLWMKVPRAPAIVLLVVALLAVPIQSTLIPLLQVYSGGAHWTLPGLGATVTLIPDVDLAGTLTAVWLTHVGFGIPFGVFLIYHSMAQLPAELFETAFVDGADHSTVLWRIALPLSLPVLAAFAVLQFLATWNDFLVALTLIGGTNPDVLPATVRITSIEGGAGPLAAGGAFVHSAVAIAVFFALQRHVVRGLLTGTT